MTSQKDHLNVYIEGLSGERLEASISQQAKIGEIVSSFWDALGLSSIDTKGRSQRLTVELINPQNPDSTKLLRNDMNIAEAGVKDGDILRIFVESTAGCFPPGTKVSFPNGQKVPIEQLKLGDTVLSYAVESQSTSTSQIVDIYHGEEDCYLIINDSLIISPSHLIYANNNWILAEQVRAGDYLHHENGELMRVNKIELIDGKMEVYNITLSPPSGLFVHGYLVSDASKDDNCQTKDAVTTFFAEGYLVRDFAAKIAAINLPLPREASAIEIVSSPFPESDEKQGRRQPLLEWWAQIMLDYGHYSCYGIFLLLPSDKEVIRYVVDFSDELDLISAADCLIVALGSSSFRIANSSSFSNPWELAIETQVSAGYSVKVANLFEIDYSDFPCLLLFKDIVTEDHLIVRLSRLTAEETAILMRKTFSQIHKAAREKQDPLTYITNGAR